MININSWQEYCKTLPLVACVGLVDEWMTIYACLQNAVKVFDYVVVIGDNATPKAIKYFEKFLDDHESLKDKIDFIELGHIDPWPWLACPRNNTKYEKIEDIPKNSWAKSMNKRLSYTRVKYPNSIIVSLHSDVIMYHNSRGRMIDRFCNMQNPFFDSEWFCMSYVAGFDKITGPHEVLEDGSRKGPSDLKQRVWYDYPGDWGLAGCYASSLLTAGPDPISTFAECFYPWNAKTQKEKKGHDTNPPYAVHLGWCKDSYANQRHHDPKSFALISDLNDPYVRIDDIKSCYFPNYIVLDDTGFFRYQNNIFD